MWLSKSCLSPMTGCTPVLFFESNKTISFCFLRVCLRFSCFLDSRKMCSHNVLYSRNALLAGRAVCDSECPFVRLFFNYGCSNHRGEAKVSRRHDDEGLLLLKTLLLLGRLLLLVLAMLEVGDGLLGVCWLWWHVWYALWGKHLRPKFCLECSHCI